jgi:hypothetical protein
MIRRRHPAPRPKDAGRTRNLFFFPEAARRRPRWRRHHPADEWTRGFAPPRNTDTPPAETRPGFLTLTPHGKREFYAEPETAVAGRVTLVLLALSLLLIRLFC